MTAKTKAQQDALAGPFVSSIRSAMRAIDRIAATTDTSNAERVSAIARVQSYAERRAKDVANEPWEDETSPSS